MAFNMEEELGDKSYGEAHVAKPEASGSSINQYITYLVQVSLEGDSYSSRKRYSDFEWFRNALTACFPGVRIPPLPKKHGAAQGLLAKTGRFEDAAFIESRRAGLEEFLKRCLQKKQLCVDSKILKGFLGTTTEESLQEFKGKIDSVSFDGKCKKYAQIYEAFKDASIPAEDRISPCKLLLKDQMQQLREIADGFKAVAEAQEAVTKALASAQTKLKDLSSSEADSLERAGVSKEPRSKLVEGLRQQSTVMNATPAMHYDLLYEAAERELLEAEAMHEALESVDNLQRDLQDAKQRTETMGATLKGVIAGGEIPSTGTGLARMIGIAAPKDRQAQIDEMKAEYEKKQKDVVAMEEFLRLSRRVLICREIDAFFKEKVTGHSQARDAFAGLSQGTAERFLSIWGGAGGSGVPARMPATSADPLEADVEYE